MSKSPLEEHEIPFTNEWYDKSYETFGMMSKAFEIAILQAGYKLISAFGGMLIIVSICYKFLVLV